jgi:hypothetical protein
MRKLLIACAVVSAALFGFGTPLSKQLLETIPPFTLGNQRRARGHRRSRLIPAVEFLQPQRLRAMIMRQFADVVSKYDVYIAPYM